MRAARSATSERAEQNETARRRRATAGQATARRFVPRSSSVTWPTAKRRSIASQGKKTASGGARTPGRPPRRSVRDHLEHAPGDREALRCCTTRPRAAASAGAAAQPARRTARARRRPSRSPRTSRRRSRPPWESRSRIVIAAATSSSARRQLRQVAPHGCVEVELASLRKPDRSRRRERLRDRAGLKDRVLVDRKRVVHTRDPELEPALLAVGQQPERHSRHAQLGHRLLGDRAQRRQRHAIRRASA